MNALVTGATGFIGSHLAEELVKQGYNVTCLVRKGSDLKWIEGLTKNLYYGDCGDEKSLNGLSPYFDYVFHAAGLTKARRDEDFFYANVKGTENLLKAVSGKMPGLKRLVFLSSLAAAGPSRNGSLVNEDSEPSPVSRYGESKLKGEQLLSGYRAGIPITIIRPPAVYGPRDRDFYVLFRMLKKGFYPYWGKCYYSLLYVEDLVTAIIRAAESKEAEGKTYFISDSKVYTNDDIAEEIANVFRTRPIKVKIPMALMSILIGIGGRLSSGPSLFNRDKLRELSYESWICDPSKAEKELGFVPKVTLKEGIKWTADWYRIHRWL